MAGIIFAVLSKFGKAIRLTDSIWHGKILLEHPEFAAKSAYLEEVRKTVGEESGYFRT